MNTTSRKDFTQVAFRVAQIATGETEPDKPLTGKKSGSSIGGKKIENKKAITNAQKKN